jgi:hypothetical protein
MSHLNAASAIAEKLKELKHEQGAYESAQARKTEIADLANAMQALVDDAALAIDGYPTPHLHGRMREHLNALDELLKKVSGR